ncbi:hypothetical protein ACFOVU_21345 [Nocardiopsis sediminis]|uniref:DUF2461 family protein n=1 Tax=Nocardiopsis sediminis TaxID=1778267 RepID=A0ABV8FQR9_9ACTN
MPDEEELNAFLPRLTRENRDWFTAQTEPEQDRLFRHWRSLAFPEYGQVTSPGAPWTPRDAVPLDPDIIANKVITEARA